MRLTYEQVRKMNEIQIDILREFISICDRLNLHYYMVHGSLLGTYTRGAFYPFDDDIDVAMPREDYDILMKKGADFTPDGYFLQSNQTERDFPVTLGKMRNSNTAFIQPMLKHLNINMGMFIDIFPIDYYPDNKLQVRWLRLKDFLYSARISTRYNYEEPQPFWRKVSRIISVLLCPSWKKAVDRKSSLYTKVRKTVKVVITGGKPCERGIPAEWFSTGVTMPFEGIDVMCPKDSDAYLKHIYGDYQNYNPVGKYMNEDDTLTVSASIVDPEKSYREYLK